MPVGGKSNGTSVHGRGISAGGKYAICPATAALVKKVVSDEVQFFPTNSTMQSGICVKPEKSFG
jgi:hypothetical protein